MRIALAQIDAVVGDLDGNRELILGMIAEARDAGADLVVLPELAVTGYPPEDLLLRPGFVHASREAVDEVARACTTTTALVRHLLNGESTSGSIGTLGAFDGHGEEVSSTAGLPPDSKLNAGAPRGAPNAPPRNLDNDVWAADIHMTPDEKLMYISERTTGSLSGFRVDGATGKLTYVGNTTTEKQPRGFAIDPKGKFLVASGEKSPTISVYAIDPASGALRMLKQYPVGKGANWVEIVSFD